MTYRRDDRVPAAFGRPAASQRGEVPGLGLVFLLLLIGGLVSIGLALGTLGEDSAAARPAGGIGRLLGYGEPERMQVGYVAPPDGAQPIPGRASSAHPSPAQPGVEVAGLQVAPAAPVAPTAPPTATPRAERFRVANTDGQGVVLHTAPSRSARVPRGLLEGAVVSVVRRQGSEWALVRAENGQEGWVGAAYLVPAP